MQYEMTTVFTETRTTRQRIPSINTWTYVICDSMENMLITMNNGKDKSQ